MIGKKATIVNRDCCYDNYEKWANLYGFELNKGKLPDNGAVGTIISYGKHITFSDIIYRIDIDGIDYIMAKKGISIEGDDNFQTHNSLVLLDIKEKIDNIANYDDISDLITDVKELVSKLIQEQL